MKLLINLFIVLFSGWVTHRYFGKNAHGLIGVIFIGLIGGSLGYYFLAASIRDYISPTPAKIIANLIGSIVLQLLYNLTAGQLKKNRGNQND